MYLLLCECGDDDEDKDDEEEGLFRLVKPNKVYISSMDR